MKPVNSVLEHVSDGIMTVAKDWTITNVNRSVEQQFAKPQKDFIGKLFWEVFPYLQDNEAKESLTQAMRDDRVRRLRVFHPPRYAWHDVILVPGDEGVTLIMRDVTDIVRARQTDAVKEGIREVLDRAPIAITLLRGPEHRVEIMNPIARELLGNQNLEGRSLRAALPELQEQGFFEVLDNVFQTGRPYESKRARVKYDKFGTGDLYEGWFDLAYQPVFDNGGKVTGILSISVEVTDYVQSGSGPT